MNKLFTRYYVWRARRLLRWNFFALRSWPAGEVVRPELMKRVLENEARAREFLTKADSYGN